MTQTELLAEYFSNKALDAMDQLCKNSNLNTAEIQSWATEHMRTPYNYSISAKQNHGWKPIL